MILNCNKFRDDCLLEWLVNKITQTEPDIRSGKIL